jgi:hypothetical protein
MSEIGKLYKLRILLVLVDDENNLTVLQELNKIAIMNDFTLLLTWSNLECARYLETFKSYENKSSTSIQAKDEVYGNLSGGGYSSINTKAAKVLTSHFRAINKTDIMTLFDSFHTLGNIVHATEEELIVCPGIGEKKAKRLYSTFHEPFTKAIPTYYTKATGTVSASSSSNTIHKRQGASVAASSDGSSTVVSAEFGSIAQLIPPLQPQPLLSVKNNPSISMPSGPIAIIEAKMTNSDGSVDVIDLSECCNQAKVKVQRTARKLQSSSTEEGAILKQFEPELVDLVDLENELLKHAVPDLSAEQSSHDSDERDAKRKKQSNS